MPGFRERLMNHPSARQSRNVQDLTRDPFVNMMRQMNSLATHPGRPVHPHTGEFVEYGYRPDVLYQARDPLPVTQWPMPYRSETHYFPNSASGPAGIQEIVVPPVTPADNTGFQHMMMQLQEAYPPQLHPFASAQPSGFSSRISQLASKAGAR